jgi:Arc/MetJ family transcription regulator
MGRARTTEHVIQRTTVEIDMTELDAAKEILGTGTIRDTVNTALREVRRRSALAKAAALIERGGFDIVEPEGLTALRRVRTED